MPTRFSPAKLSRNVVLLWMFIAGGCTTAVEGPQGGRFLPGDGLPDATPVDVAMVPDAVPVNEPLSTTGNRPYQVFGKNYTPLRSSRGYWAEGYASWYGTKFHGRRTSSGEPYDMYSMSAAHRTLPLPSYLRVSNLANQRSVIVKVNDRGPFVDTSRRVIDLSYAAAVRLDMIGSGTARVRIEAVQPGDTRAETRKSAPTATSTSTGATLDPENASYLQLGAFSDQRNAQLLQDRVTSIGAAAFVEQAGGLYKVKSGPYADADKALQHKLEIDRMLNIEAMVVFE